MSRDVSARGLAITIALAGAMLGLGAVFAFRPVLVLEAVPELESTLVALDPAMVVLVIAMALVLLAPLLGILGRVRAPSPRPLGSSGGPNSSKREFGTDRETPSAGLIESSPANTGVTGPRKPVGESYERHLEIATASGERSQRDRDAAREQFVESMRPIAATAVAARTGLDEAGARLEVEAGTWTDDVRAAAFLADEDGQSIPIFVWLFDLFRTTDPFVRHLEHTIEAIEALRDGSDSGDSSIRRGSSERGTNRAERDSNRAGSEVSS